MKTEAADPWREIPRPKQGLDVGARRIDPTLPWDLFWAVDAKGRCLLLLQHETGRKWSSRLPKLRGLEVDFYFKGTGDRDLLVLRLLDDESREIFHRLCLDIVSAVGKAQSEREAIERFLGRTLRWHRLLRSGRDDRLSDEEQRGLLGELKVLRNVLFPILGVRDAVGSWTGPLGTPKDFEIGRVCIEVKARRGASVPSVSISSEHQLDTTGVDALFLCVLEITETSKDDRDAVTITDVVRQLRREVEVQDLRTTELFEERLSAVGFEWTDDYSDKWWSVGREHVFDVKEDFPRITSSSCPVGVQDLRYAISLSVCEPFRTDMSNLGSRISGGLHDVQRR